MSIEENLKLMKTLDDAWNGQDWDLFSKRHAENVVVRWPGQDEPTRGLAAHKNEGIEMFRIFPDNHVANDPYKVLFGQGEWTCSIAIFTGTHQGPMIGSWRQNHYTYKQEIPSRILHSSPLEKWPNSRGESFLRPSRNDEAAGFGLNI